ncbi:MAG TPA: DUF126 domain-containing protein [Candidatus Limnocylindria bacterium]|nr:DUF126 domain-containing protein [Candidatus Limnocylindria bacterium]
MAERPRRLRGRALVAGRAGGVALVLDEPLSFWGGLEPASGVIVDERHPQHGQGTAGRVLVMPGARGSSSSSSVLAEAIRSGRGPAAIILARAEGIVALGALVVRLLDGRSCPVVELNPSDYAGLRSGDLLDVDPNGEVEVRRPRAVP